MEPITLATVTTAATTLALDAAKDAASDVAKQAWEKIKGWLGWTKTPPTEDLAGAIASALAKNTDAAESIIAELKARDTGLASRLASKVEISFSNTAGNARADRDVIIVQG